MQLCRDLSWDRSTLGQSLLSTRHGRLDTALEAVVQQAQYGGMKQVIVQDAQHFGSLVGLGSRCINTCGCTGSMCIGVHKGVDITLCKVIE